MATLPVFRRCSTSVVSSQLHAIRSARVRANVQINPISILCSQYRRQELSWTKYSRLRNKTIRTLSTVADESSVPAKENTEKGIQLSDSCVKQIGRLMDGSSTQMLRVIVEGGGCSGFQYRFDIDGKINEDDKVFEREGAKVVIDDLSLGFLEGSTVDYHQELIRSSFRIVENPNAEQGCSCGASFALK